MYVPFNVIPTYLAKNVDMRQTVFVISTIYVNGIDMVWLRLGHYDTLFRFWKDHGGEILRILTLTTGLRQDVHPRVL